MDFAQTETEYRRLRDQLDSGQLSEAEFKAQLQDLMVEDEQGRWWVIGYETGQWYVHDGEKWQPAQPPGAAPPQVAEPTMAATDQPAVAATPAVVAESATDAAPAAASTGPSTRRMATTRWALALIIVVWAACSGFLYGLYYTVGFWGPWLNVAMGAWFLAGLAVGVALRLVAPTARWGSIVLAALVWGACYRVLIHTEALDSVAYSGRYILVGLIGGLATGLVAKQALALMRWHHVLVIAAAWAVAQLVDVEVAPKVINEVPDSLYPVVGAVSGAVSGAIGGGVTLWLTRRSQRAAAGLK